MGRPPKPIELKRLQGFPGHHPRQSPTLVAGRIGPDDRVATPAGLSPQQRKAWNELVSALKRGGFLDFADLSVLEAAASALGRAREARAVVNKEGLFQVTSQGRGAHPAVAIERESLKEYRQLAVQLGVGPSARARLGAGQKPASMEDEIERTLGTPARLRAVSD